MAEERHHDQRQACGGGNRVGEEVLAEPQRLGPVGEHEDREDVERHLLGHPQQRAEDHLAPLPPDDLRDRLALDALVLHLTREQRRLEDTQADP